MKVVLLGATGKVGAPILNELVQRGHQVTAVVRDTSRLPEASDHVVGCPGDVFDETFLSQAVRGADAVVCSVALRDPAQKDRTPSDLLAGVAAATARSGARLVTMGGAGSLRTASGVDLVDTPEFPEVAKPESLGFREALHHLMADAPSDLSWTMVSPPASIEIEGPKTGTYRIADDTLITDDRGASHISAADLAVAVVDEIEEPKHVRRRFTVGY